MDYNYNTMLNRIDKISSLNKEEDYKELLNNLLYIKKQNEYLLNYDNKIKNYKKIIKSKNKEIFSLKEDITNLELDMTYMNYN